MAKVVNFSCLLFTFCLSLKLLLSEIGEKDGVSCFLLPFTPL
ncbi:hypothetical protein HMPREF1869_00353 [Bacteroidales bacterium KA00251]|nr:hypothetical protein HMPREF1869_00353 [Bacteroidales bacterium KA00251]